MRWLFILFLMVTVVLPLAAVDEPADSALTVEDDPARQLRIYREALVQGSTEEIRIDAAMGLLLNRDAASRDLLVSTLRLSDNPLATKAVCKALIKTRAAGTSIGSREMFFEPLLGLLIGGDAETSRLSAEALLVFRFDDIAQRLYDLSHDASLDRRVRGHVIYALQIRPEPEALSELIKLLDESDADVARAAETALQEAFGIPVGTSRQVWEQILNDLRQKSPNEIRRERLLRQEMKLREMQAERDRWQRLYLGALDRQYEGGDEGARMALVLDRLGSDLAAIRIWALDKVDRYPANGQMDLREKLLGLLGDESRLVRLKTARVLNNMSALNPAEKLLERFRVEQDTEVALALFEALGEACFFAFSPGSKIELPEEIKYQTLEISEGYLNSDDVEIAKKGAEITRKLLELDGLLPEMANHYLDVLANRYEISVARNTPIRGDLLGMMARLVGRGAQRERAAGMYRGYFVEAIGVDDNPGVRLAAATGLSNLDKAEALKLYRQHNLMQKGGAAVRHLVIEAASQVGRPDDLTWLSELLTVNGFSDSSMQAFRAICQREGAYVSSEWAERLDNSDFQSGFVRELLELAEQKAAVEKNELLLADVRTRLAEWFVRREMPEPLAGYLDRLKAGGGSLAFPDAVGGRLIGVLVGAGFYDAAIELVRVRLERGSLNRESAIVVKLDGHFQSELVPLESKNGLYTKLAELNTNPSGQFWTSKLKIWQEQIRTEPVTASVLDPEATTQP